MSRVLGRLTAWLLVMVAWPLMAIHRVAFWIDSLVDPSLDNQPLERPLFIVGVPRSGTTAFHRLIAENDARFTSMQLWEVLFAPALCEKRILCWLQRMDRRLGNPAGRLFGFAQRSLSRGLDDVHPTDLSSPEEDYLALLPFGGCFLTVLLFPFRKACWDLVYFDRMSEVRQRRLLRAYRGILIRHLAFAREAFRKRGHAGNDSELPTFVLSKNPSFTSWVDGLAMEFPDARFVGLRRPLPESLPSQLSSMRAGFACFGVDVTDPQIVERFRLLFLSYWSSLNRYERQLDAERYVGIEYPRLRSAPFETLVSCFHMLGYGEIHQSPQKLMDATNRLRAYVSRHQYDLESFGLAPEDLSTVSTAVASEPLSENAISTIGPPADSPFQEPSHAVTASETT
ncbi:MAG: sulfotransferase [Planctomycetota bacterium]